ncbi:LAQU0S04e06282g1_1 [Lachancea quebecensis]|uniref:LAQU0S04e06282g1_1 n=1 Tax=Lachancea quebecensis TaxID=1654605 RepID=A0A0P1KRE3_9SACH|nr:LAQU0S04e06282g1_1 [Lachancea quebecensis]
MDGCPICFESLSRGACRLVECGHKYHFNCIRRWHYHSKNLQCPTCRITSRHLEDIERKVTINLAQFSDANLAISEITAQVGSLEIRSNDAQQEETRWTLEALNCKLCGEPSVRTNVFCQKCHTAYHEICLRTLHLEVGDFSRCVACCNCHQIFGSSSRELPSYRERSTRLLVERPGLHAAETQTHRSVRAPALDGFEVVQSWRLLSELQQQHCLLDLSEHKRKIQAHVRKVLNSHYAKGSGAIATKDQYTEINKIVSRNLYRISDNRYQPDKFDYDIEALRLIAIELRKIE